VTARVIVVGGGLAGLAAAIRASDDGADVTLLELAPRLGGLTWSFRRNGLSYDNGQHVFMRCCTEYRAFLQRIGSDGKVVLQDRLDVPVQSPDGTRAHLRRDALPSPLHLARSLAGYRHLRPLQRAAAARAALALKRVRLGDPDLDDHSFGAWLAEHGVGADAHAPLWDLVVRATVNLPAADASLALAAKVFKTGLLDTNDGADLGWSTVPLRELHGDAAAAVLARAGAEVRLGTRVTAVTSGPYGPEVATDGEVLRADAVVVALPHDAAAAVLPNGTFPGQSSIAELGHSPIVNVHLLYDRTVLDVPFLAAVDSPVQFVFDRTDSSGAPAGHQAVAISLSTADDLVSVKSRDLVARLSAELARLLPAVNDARVVSSLVTREVAATFRGTAGTARLRPPPNTGLAGIVLAGAWTDTGWPATMEGAVRSGNAAAGAVRSILRAQRTTGAVLMRDRADRRDLSIDTERGAERRSSSEGQLVFDDAEPAHRSAAPLSPRVAS